MPEQRLESNVYGDFAKDEWSVVNAEQKGTRMSFSGLRSLLLWCRQQTECYSEVNVINMTTSWRDGLAFCAIIHRFRPDLINFDRLSKENIMENNELAFTVAEKHLGIPMVLDASDMVESDVPDKLTVITYVSQLYEYFKKRTPANQGYATKINIKPKPRAEAKSQKGSKRTSPSNQMYVLSGHAKRVATALRNVFKSDHKEESGKGKDPGQSGKYYCPTRTSLETARSSDEPSPNITRKLPFLGNDCCICHNRVYIMERLIAERKLFHRACFRCSKCDACLRPGTYHYFTETEKFCCLFDCARGQRETPINIKLEPISDAAQESHSQQNTSSKAPSADDQHSTDSAQQAKSSLQRQFSIVKKNAIHLNALPQPLSKTARGSKQFKSSKSLTKLQQKGGIEKKRRLSGNGWAKNKHNAQGKHTRSEKQCDQAKVSWSPVPKRHASETVLKGKIAGSDDKINTDEASKVLKPILPNGNLVSNEANEEEMKVKKSDQGKPVHLKTREEKRRSREGSVYEPSSENLFFSFKEELLKRAVESKGKDSGEVEQVTKENKFVDGYASKVSYEKGNTRWNNGCHKEFDSSGNGVDHGCCNLFMDSDVKDTGKERRCSEDKIVGSDSTTGSSKSSVSEVEAAPIVAKSVQKLREKFLNINSLIEEKSKTNIAKRSQEIQRELRCVSAWKQQTESHGAALRKLSAGREGKSSETRRQSFGTSRRSVKELRKMYMGNESGENNGSKERINFVRSKSMKATVNMERKSSTSGKKAIPFQTSQEESEKKIDCTELESNLEDNPASSENCDTAEKDYRETDKSCGYTKNSVFVQVDDSPGNAENRASGYNKQSASPLLPNQIDGKEGRTNTVVNTEDVQNEVPTLQIQPASPDNNGQQRSPGLKTHAVSHDSGIDEPPLHVQNNLLNTVADKKISDESLKVSAEFSLLGSRRTELSLNLQPSKIEPGGDLQSPGNPLSPGSDLSPVEVFWSLPLSVGSRTSLTDTSSSCSSPRMSVVIAQEASATKINSRFFTVETMEPWDSEDHRIAEERQCIMEVEGEFSFGREKRKSSRAEREAIYSLHRDAKRLGLNETGLIKEEEITLSPSEIDAELQSLEMKHGVLERRGVQIEHHLRQSMDSEGLYSNNEDDLLCEWLIVVHERNKILRRESELIYLLQSHHYEERYRTVEGELRKLVAMRDEVKSSDDLKRERELLSELLELVQRRSFIVDSLEEERVRELQEDEKVEQALTDGIAALPDNCWDQRADFTKVAFSRFYC